MRLLLWLKDTVLGSPDILERCRKCGRARLTTGTPGKNAWVRVAIVVKPMAEAMCCECATREIEALKPMTPVAA